MRDNCLLTLYARRADFTDTLNNYHTYFVSLSKRRLECYIVLVLTAVPLAADDSTELISNGFKSRTQTQARVGDQRLLSALQLAVLHHVLAPLGAASQVPPISLRLVGMQAVDYACKADESAQESQGYSCHHSRQLNH